MTRTRIAFPRAARVALIAVVSSSLLGVAACGAGAPVVTAPEPTVASAAVAFDGGHIDAGAFADAIAAADEVIDVRTTEEFAAGHLPGALNIDIESADFTAKLAELDPQGSYAVYCRSGNRSRVAIDAMAGAGVTATVGLEGGITAWSAAGGDIVTDEA